MSKLFKSNLSFFKKSLATSLLFPALAIAAAAPAASDKPVMIAPNQTTLEVNLSGNPSTGYGWYLKKINTHFFKLTQYQFIAGNTQMPGAPGKAVFTFQIDPSFHTAPYSTQISFAYMRPWEASSEMDKSLMVLSIPGATVTTPPAPAPAPVAPTPAPAQAPVDSTPPEPTPAGDPADTQTASTPSTTQSTWLSIPSNP